jgi:hypothetical protein
MVQAVKNPNGKLVCVADKDGKKVEVKNGEYKTTFYFTKDGELKVEHTKVA